MGRETMFDVTVFYREPTYEQRAGAKAEPYAHPCEVQAADEAEAVRRATEMFNAEVQRSSIGWVREIVSVRAVPKAQ
jgi:hypothetical protein